MHVKTGDKVKILTGKDKGKTGKIVRALPKKNRVAVEDINIYKKHVRPQKEGETGETVEVSRPIHVSNVMLICPSCSDPVKTGWRTEGDEKVRYCKKCDQPIID